MSLTGKLKRINRDERVQLSSTVDCAGLSFLFGAASHVEQFLPARIHAAFSSALCFLLPLTTPCRRTARVASKRSRKFSSEFRCRFIEVTGDTWRKKIEVENRRDVTRRSVSPPIRPVTSGSRRRAQSCRLSPACTQRFSLNTCSTHRNDIAVCRTDFSICPAIPY